MYGLLFIVLRHAKLLDNIFVKLNAKSGSLRHRNVTIDQRRQIANQPTHQRRRGAIRQYSTSGFSGPSAAIQCNEAARLIPVLKQ